MTIVMAWRTDTGIMVAADTRISNDKSTLTDVGQKIFQVPVSITPFGLDERSISKPPIGFAFAGNTLLAQSCCVIASTCLASLGAQTADCAPSPEDYSAYFASCAQYVCRERRFWTPNTVHRFESIVFGFDEQAGDAFLFELKTEVQDDEVHVASHRVDLKLGGLAYFGSGKEAVSERLDELEKTGGRISPQDLLDEVVGSSSLPSVGGSLQFARATRDGVQLHPMMRVGPSGAATITVLGCDVARLAPIGDFFPGSAAVAFSRRTETERQ